MKKMKKYTACVREKGTKRYTDITSEYSSKKIFAEDLRRNGYTVLFIAPGEKGSVEYFEAETKYYTRRHGYC